MEIETRVQELAALRARWKPARETARLRIRREHAAWCNAGIEGNPLSWERARELLADGEAADRFERELLGCAELAAFLEAWSGPLDLALLRHLHALLMAGLDSEAGSLRRTEVAIVRESGPGAGETVFKPPHPLQVPQLLERLLAATQVPADPFLAAGRFHYEFQSVHPFSDGNGRLGRALTSYLARRGWDSPGFHLEPAVARSGPAYYLALRAVRPDYDSEIADGLKPWLLPYFDMIEDALVHPEAPEESRHEIHRHPH